MRVRASPSLLSLVGRPCVDPLPPLRSSPTVFLSTAFLSREIREAEGERRVQGGIDLGEGGARRDHVKRILLYIPVTSALDVVVAWDVVTITPPPPYLGKLRDGGVVGVECDTTGGARELGFALARRGRTPPKKKKNKRGARDLNCESAYTQNLGGAPTRGAASFGETRRNLRQRRRECWMSILLFTPRERARPGVRTWLSPWVLPQSAVAAAPARLEHSALERREYSLPALLLLQYALHCLGWQLNGLSAMVSVTIGHAKPRSPVGVQLSPFCDAHMERPFFPVSWLRVRIHADI